MYLPDSIPWVDNYVRCLLFVTLNDKLKPTVVKTTAVSNSIILSRFYCIIEYKDVWGEGSIRYSEQVMTSYVSRYATSTRLGHVPTDEDIARIHHGGPDGWNDASTLEYWRNVSKAMNLARAGE